MQEMAYNLCLVDSDTVHVLAVRAFHTFAVGLSFGLERNTGPEC